MPNKPFQTIALIAGLATAAPALANEPASASRTPELVPTRAAGTLYVNLQTGERTLTRYANLAEIEPYNPAAAALFDYWIVLDPNPCWDDPRADGFAYFADAPSDSSGSTPITEPVIGFDFGDLPFDSKITGVIISTSTLATESIDSNNDGTPDTGIDVVAAFYDALSEGNRASIAPPTAAVRIQAIPGQDATQPDVYETYDLILDFGGSHFELGDSDAQNRGDLWLPGANAGLDFSALITTQTSCETTTSGGLINCQTISIPNPTADGLADFQYLQHYAQFDTNDKVTDVSTFIGLGAADGLIEFFTFTTIVTTLTTELLLGSATTSVHVVIIETIFVPDELPAGQSAFEGFGVGALGQGSDLTNLDWSIGGCCFWFGGLDCAGFLEQVEPEPPLNPSWYNFTPFAQNRLGLLSDTPAQSVCQRIDYAQDGLIDNGDISGFVQLFLAKDVAAVDLNNDNVCDNGDIAAFVQIFLACTG